MLTMVQLPPKVIGICGGIGSGKSILSKLLSLQNIPVFDTDLSAKNIYFEPNIREELEYLIGNPIFTTDGNLDKPLLGNIVFGSDRELKEKLESIVHRGVREEFNRWVKNQGTSYVGVESGILFTSGFNNLCDKIVLVTSSKDERVKRVCRRNNLPAEDVIRRIESQNREEKLAEEKADYIIKNSEPYSLILQWEAVFKKINTKKNQV